MTEGDFTYTVENGQATIVGIADNVTSIDIPKTLGEYPVAGIGENAFNGCSNVITVKIPNSVTSIGKEAFCECVKLKEVKIGNSVTSIASGTFGGCTSLTKAIIPDFVTEIGEKAFDRCEHLEEVVIPNSVTSIGGYFPKNAVITCNEGSFAHKHAMKKKLKFSVISE